MRVKDLSPNPKNPRTVTEEKLAQLKKSYAEFGFLGGVVNNVTTKHLVAGHQTIKTIDAATDITIEKKYKKPTKQGTVAEGFILLPNGEKITYREVAWDKTKEKAATIAANNNAGEWNHELLGDWMKDLSKAKFDLDLTMFDVNEIKGFSLNSVRVSEHERTGSKELNESDFSEFEHTCPKCGFEFDAKPE